MTETGNMLKAALEELGGVLARLDEGRADAACRMLADADKIMVCGCGREMLQMKGFAMRLFHLGLNVSIAGDITAPPIGAGDVLLATAGPGELASVETLMRLAAKAGAKTLLVTAQPDRAAGRLADFILVLPAQTMADDQGPAKTSVLPMGSVYEGALFLLFEIMVLKLKDLLGSSLEDMRARHTNME